MSTLKEKKNPKWYSLGLAENGDVKLPPYPVTAGDKKIEIPASYSRSFAKFIASPVKRTRSTSTYHPRSFREYKVQTVNDTQYTFSFYPEIIPKTTEEPETIEFRNKDFNFATDSVKKVTEEVFNMLAKHHFDMIHDEVFDGIFDGDAYKNRHFDKIPNSHTTLGMSDGFLERIITQRKICFVNPAEELDCPEGVSLEQFDFFVTARRVLMRRIQTLIYYGCCDRNKMANLRLPGGTSLDPKYIICSTLAGTNIMNSKDSKVDKNWGGEVISPVYQAGIIEEKFLLFDIAHALNPSLTVFVTNKSNKCQQHQCFVYMEEDLRRLTVHKNNENDIVLSHPMAMTHLYHNYIVKPGTILQNEYTVPVPKKTKVSKKTKRKSSNSVSSSVLTAGSRTGTSVSVDDIKTSSPLSANSANSGDYQSANSVLCEVPPFKKGKTVKSVGKSDDISQVSATEGSTAPVSVHKVSPTRAKARREQQRCNLEVKRIADINKELNLGINVETIKNYIRSLEEAVSSKTSDKSLICEKVKAFVEQEKTYFPNPNTFPVDVITIIDKRDFISATHNYRVSKHGAYKRIMDNFTKKHPDIDWVRVIQLVVAYFTGESSYGRETFIHSDEYHAYTDVLSIIAIKSTRGNSKGSNSTSRTRQHELQGTNINNTVRSSEEAYFILWMYMKKTPKGKSMFKKAWTEKGTTCYHMILRSLIEFHDNSGPKFDFTIPVEEKTGVQQFPIEVTSTVDPNRAEDLRRRKILGDMFHHDVSEYGKAEVGSRPWWQMKGLKTGRITNDMLPSSLQEKLLEDKKENAIECV